MGPKSNTTHIGKWANTWSTSTSILLNMVPQHRWQDAIPFNHSSCIWLYIYRLFDKHQTPLTLKQQNYTKAIIRTIILCKFTYTSTCVQWWIFALSCNQDYYFLWLGFWYKNRHDIITPYKNLCLHPIIWLLVQSCLLSVLFHFHSQLQSSPPLYLIWWCHCSLIFVSVGVCEFSL